MSRISVYAHGADVETDKPAYFISCHGAEYMIERGRAYPVRGGRAVQLAERPEPEPGTPIKTVAKSTGLRFRHDLLATVARLAAARNLGFDPFRIVTMHS